MLIVEQNSKKLFIGGECHLHYFLIMGDIQDNSELDLKGIGGEKNNFLNLCQNSDETIGSNNQLS